VAAMSLTDRMASWDLIVNRSACIGSWSFGRKSYLSVGD
jgi:hypothetical protein